MNGIKWHGDETIDDIDDKWIHLLEAGNEAGLTKEIATALDTGRSAHEWQDDGSLEYVGPDYSREERQIITMAYYNDVKKVKAMVRDSDEHELGENLK